VSTADEDELVALLEPEAETALLQALEAAWRPAALDAARNEHMIATALEDPLAPPTEAELVEAARLRVALEQAQAHEDADLLRGLGAAFGAGAATAPAEATLGRAFEKPARSNVIYRAFGVASLALAAAAATWLMVGSSGKNPAEAPAPSAFAEPRSTAPLFNERFETQSTTARMDLIASARGRELRGNRFAAWGVP
jgi:hypothetical protein